MNELLHANIFFFIASTATVIFSIMVAFALFYLLRILQAVRRIVDKIEAGSDQIAGDLQSAREFVVKGGLISYFINLVMPKSPRRRSAKREDVTSESE